MAALGMRGFSSRYLIIIVVALAGLHLYYNRQSYREAANNLPKFQWTASDAQKNSEYSSEYGDYVPNPSHSAVVYSTQSIKTESHVSSPSQSAVAYSTPALDAGVFSIAIATTETPTSRETSTPSPTSKLPDLLFTPVQDPNLEVTPFPTPATSTSLLPTQANSTAAAVQATATSLLPCAEFEGAEDIVFVIKTGSTEALEKLPIHVNTTLRCFPHAIIFSDYGEVISGHELRDAVGNVSSEVRDEDADFELWRKLQREGREGLDPSELSTQVSDPNAPNFDNGGWRLDKFKNVPMVVKSLEYKPDAKWYIYSDADTYVVWSNLVHWMSMFDHNELWYLGSAAVIDEQVFGHGGSGYVISNAAMKKVAEEYTANQTYWDKYAAGHWAGDCVLATVLDKIGAALTWAFPIIQGGDPVVMDYTEIGYDRRLWCYPVVTYHHILPSTLESLWHLEQEWNVKHTAATTPLKHSDVFKQWLMPRMQDELRQDWDNLSEDLVEEIQVNDASDCRMLCAGNSTCLQFSYRDSECRTNASPKLGTAKAGGGVAGWMMERLGERVLEWDECTEGDWITS